MEWEQGGGRQGREGSGRRKKESGRNEMRVRLVKVSPLHLVKFFSNIVHTVHSRMWEIFGGRYFRFFVG